MTVMTLMDVLYLIIRPSGNSHSEMVSNSCTQSTKFQKQLADDNLLEQDVLSIIECLSVQIGRFNKI